MLAHSRGRQVCRRLGVLESQGVRDEKQLRLTIAMMLYRSHVVELLSDITCVSAVLDHFEGDVAVGLNSEAGSKSTGSNRDC